MLPDSLQLSSKLFVDDQIDEEVCHAVDVEAVAEVAADWPFEVAQVEKRREGHDKDGKQAETDLHCFLVRFSTRNLAENIMIY